MRTDIHYVIVIYKNSVSHQYFYNIIIFLSKPTTPFETIKHQRDKQILIVYRVDIQLFNLNKGY